MAWPMAAEYWFRLLEAKALYPPMSVYGGEQVVAYGEVVDQAGCVVAVGEGYVPARGGVGDA